MDQAIWSELLVAKSIAIHPWLLEKTDATDYAAGDGSKDDDANGANSYQYSHDHDNIH